MTYLLVAVIVGGLIVDIRRGWQRGMREARLRTLRVVDQSARERGWRIRSIQHTRGRIVGAVWDNPVNSETWDWRA